MIKGNLDDYRSTISASERVHVRAERVPWYTFELDWNTVEGVPSSEASNLYEHWAERQPVAPRVQRGVSV